MSISKIESGPKINAIKVESQKGQILCQKPSGFYKLMTTKRELVKMVLL